MKDLELIEKLCNAHGVSGFEDDVTAIAREYCKGFASFKEDSMRNLYIYPNSNRGNRALVMLDAHADEVGFMVQAVKPDGTLRFIPIGGWNEKSLPSSKVSIRTEKGFVEGVISAMSPHLMTAEQRNAPVTIENLVIDIGASGAKEAAQFGVETGATAVPSTPFVCDESRGILHGKAFDDRLGVAALLMCLKNLQSETLSVDLVGVISSQEEVGERGITAVMGAINPDAAICFEGCPADDTSAPEYMVQAKLHGGVMIRYMDRSVICTPRFTAFARRTAEQNGVKHQMAVRSGGGNNGAYIISANGGTPTVVASIPVRYIHTFNSIAALEDVYSCVKLGEVLCKNLNDETIKRF